MDADDTWTTTLDQMDILAWGTEEMLTRPRVDCGQITGGFCDYCMAAYRIPKEKWAAGQRTPLCSACDRTHDCCHFCRHEIWVRPPAWRKNAKGEKVLVEE